MNQIEFAVHQTAHEAAGGVAALAKSIGVGEQVFRNKVNPYQDTHKLSLNEAVAMMHSTGDVRILEAVAADLGCSLAQPSPAAQSLVVAIISADAEHGDVARAVADAIEDKRITQAEAAAIRKEISEARHALDVLEQTLILELSKPHSLPAARAKEA